MLDINQSLNFLHNKQKIYQAYTGQCNCLCVYHLKIILTQFLVNRATVSSHEADADMELHEPHCPIIDFYASF